jgi:hypothetical protein
LSGKRATCRIHGGQAVDRWKLASSCGEISSIALPNRFLFSRTFSSPRKSRRRTLERMRPACSRKIKRRCSGAWRSNETASAFIRLQTRVALRKYKTNSFRDSQNGSLIDIWGFSWRENAPRNRQTLMHRGDVSLFSHDRVLL